ncbi:PREDICTED: uncharacterized protein LOC106100815 isoform X2 [Papilio polytes]|uniref:uncharacterized protein LOC106100815 isoform X2 n=1 Tax=Papilio polytes TaxID=76194 RepID=UPI0006764B0D|nr:PREDICTED: uncharacterized protein LOC106100815 isoform X2 [Papilio polytes]
MNVWEEELDLSWDGTHRKRVTPFWQTIPKSVKMRYPKNKPFGIYNNPYKFQLPYMLRRTELDESNGTKNETCPKEIMSANYLSKIKKLEEELQRVREQLKAKVTTLKKDGDTDNVQNKNNELYFRVSDLSSPVTIKDVTNRPTMIEFKSILINNTIENKTNDSEEVSHESREMSFDLPYNMTFIDHRNHSIYITNQTSMELFSPETTLVVKNVTMKPINKPLAITTNLTDVEDTTIYFKKINNTSHEAIDH